MDLPARPVLEGLEGGSRRRRGEGRKPFPLELERFFEPLGVREHVDVREYVRRVRVLGALRDLREALDRRILVPGLVAGRAVEPVIGRLELRQPGGERIARGEGAPPQAAVPEEEPPAPPVVVYGTGFEDDFDGGGATIFLRAVSQRMSSRAGRAPIGSGSATQPIPTPRAATRSPISPTPRAT